MAKQTEKGRVVKEALANFPKTSKKTLAELVFKNNQVLFKDAEEARRVIRYYTGASGNYHRDKVKEIIPHETDFSPQNPYGLPPTEEV